MSGKLTKAGLWLLRSLDIKGGGFHAFPSHTDWHRLRAFRLPYCPPSLPEQMALAFAKANTPNVDIREYSASWGDLVEAGVVDVGHLHDDCGRVISPLGFALTPAGRRARHCQPQS